MLKKILSITAACFLLWTPQVFSQSTINLDLNAIYGANNLHTLGAVDFAERVKEYSQGSIQITVHPGGSLGFSGPELLRSVRDGLVPMSDILMGVVAGSEHVFGMSSLPRLVSDFDESRQLYEAAKPAYEKAAAKWKQKLLYAAPWPPSGLVTKNIVNTTADLNNLKTRTYDRNGAEFLRALGSSPVSMPWGEVYSSLTTGTIDSVLTSSESAKDGKFWEILNGFKIINYAYPLNMVTINLDYWNAMSKAQQDAMLKAAAETEAAQWKKAISSNDEGLAIIKENGMNVSDADSAFVTAMNNAAKIIIDEYRSKADKEVNDIIGKFTK
ncbi:MAG: TRAP transporter substrate-binding protein [Desulfuromonadales bacterium]|nr:TRAP transporter substrate-binding protein [Desulfuromonadales bacterium]